MTLINDPGPCEQDAGIDDLIGPDEELEDGDQDVAKIYREQQLHSQRDQEMTAEQVEAYVKSRFQQPSAQGYRDQEADAGRFSDP